MSQKHRFLKFACMALTVLLIAGCVERSITINSNPPYAQVFLDGESIGETSATDPLTVPFTFYGTREIMIRKEGYITHRSLEKISPPFYQIIPLDLFFEALYPFTLHDSHVLTFNLEPRTETNLEEMTERAENFRSSAKLRLEKEQPK